MKVFWRKRRAGQRLILVFNGEEIEVGAFRSTSRGYDALAKTMGYDPGRAQKGFPTEEDAKSFVESFQPWDLYTGAEHVEVDPEVYPPSESDL